MNLARKLDDELEELNALSGSSGETSTNLKALDSLTARPPVDISSNLRFVFSDTQQVVSPPGDATPPRPPEKGSTLQPSMNIPEDVESSRASSPLQKSQLDDENTTSMYRVKQVETVSTPLAISNDIRVSDHTSPVDEPVLNVEMDVDNHSRQTRIKSQASLQPPSAGLTRSSYMTSSTSGSRISGLSDFPAPPGEVGLTPAHMSLLDSYFDNRSSTQTVDPFPPGSRTISRMTFGGDEDIEDIANALSSHP